MGDEIEPGWDGEERRDTSLADVHAGMLAVAGSMSEMAEAIGKASDRRQRWALWWLALLTLGVAFLTIVAGVNYEGTRLIRDCTTVGGECYTRAVDDRLQAREDLKAAIAAAGRLAAQQVECDAGIHCAPGIVKSTPTPTTTVPG